MLLDVSCFVFFLHSLYWLVGEERSPCSGCNGKLGHTLVLSINPTHISVHWQILEITQATHTHTHTPTIKWEMFRQFQMQMVRLHIARFAASISITFIGHLPFIIYLLSKHIRSLVHWEHPAISLGGFYWFFWLFFEFFLCSIIFDDFSFKKNLSFPICKIFLAPKNFSRCAYGLLLLILILLLLLQKSFHLPSIFQLSITGHIFHFSIFHSNFLPFSHVPSKWWKRQKQKQNHIANFRSPKRIPALKHTHITQTTPNIVNSPDTFLLCGIRRQNYSALAQLIKFDSIVSKRRSRLFSCSSKHQLIIHWPYTSHLNAIRWKRTAFDAWRWMENATSFTGHNCRCVAKLSKWIGIGKITPLAIGKRQRMALRFG